jgi:CHAT domain-containing protein
VLSACETAAGDFRSGEGILGSQRAFRMAGASTVVMSLWPVDDKATRRFMQRLYTLRLSEGRDTAAAVQGAMLSILSKRRRKGLSTDPFYWAGFVGSGDWR